jgi:hypothetical protein
MPRKQTTTQQQLQVKKSVDPKRKGFSWSSNEVNRLHNEYELKELTVYEIADLHRRGVHAILHKLSHEGLISSNWQDARGWDFVATEKKALSAPRVQRARRVHPVLTVDDTHDYTGSCDNSETNSDDNDDSDEEYTLDDAQRDYDPFSMRDKVEFFKNLISPSLYR